MPNTTHTYRFHALLLALMSMLLFGCEGQYTFHHMARAGDTVAIAGGWGKDFKGDEITVTITTSGGIQLYYPPGHPDHPLRALVNLYPDPVSNLVVSQASGQDLSPSAQLFAELINTGKEPDRDWWQTAVFVDLPASLPVGLTKVRIESPAGEYVESDVRIVEGLGEPAKFVSNNLVINEPMLETLQRTENYTVTLQGNTVPYAVQVDLTHDPDMDHGGIGRAHVVNPRGDIKSLTWRSWDGTKLRVIITPADLKPLKELFDFKFYVAGRIENLQILDVTAVDPDGAPIVGVAAALN